jgi:hypothetical protein
MRIFRLYVRVCDGRRCSLRSLSVNEANSRTVSRMSRIGLPSERHVDAPSRLSMASLDRADGVVGPVGIKDIGMQLVITAEAMDKVKNRTDVEVASTVDVYCF